MLILKPIVHETIWGGERLARIAGSNSKTIGHLYSVYQADDQSNLILNGPWKEHTLAEYFAANKARFGLQEYPAFPLVIALVDAKEHLSIQVHPDDKTAQKLLGLPRGKNESWYFLEAPASNRIFNGCSCTSLAELEAAIQENRLGEAVGTLPVEKGDYVYVAGGTLHALSAGSLVYEIEENVEITYRFYDFDRVGPDGKKRPLQIAEAMESVHLANKSRAKRYGNEPIRERLYSTQRYTNTAGYTNRSNTLECLTVLAGTVFVEAADMTVQTGQTILLEPGETLQAPVQEMIVARPGESGGNV